MTTSINPARATVPPTHRTIRPRAKAHLRGSTGNFPVGKRATNLFSIKSIPPARQIDVTRVNKDSRRGPLMIDPVRQEVIALAHTVVVKVGTNVLTDPDGRLDRPRLQDLADQVQRLRQSGRKVVLVS